jgi:diguanylate cyclase (GGDEF)-like protein
VSSPPSHVPPQKAVGRTPADLALAVLDALPDATAVLDSHGTIIGVSRAWQLLAVDNDGDPDTTGVGINYFDVCRRAAAQGNREAADAAAGLRAVLDGDLVQYDDEYSCPSPAAGRWFLMRITPLEDASGGAVVSHVNISRRKMAEDELAHAASHDQLTGLANRALFLARLTAELTARPGRHRPDVGVLYIDLDEFKTVNDTYGHEAGDNVLLAVASRLRGLLRPHDVAARLGGDEFAVMVPRTSSSRLSPLAARLSACLAEPHRTHGGPLTVLASIGTHLAAPGSAAADALHRADVDMYRVKRAHRRALPPHTGLVQRRAQRTGATEDAAAPGPASSTRLD